MDLQCNQHSGFSIIGNHLTLARVKADNSPFKTDQGANYSIKEALPDSSFLMKLLALHITMNSPA